MVFIEKSRNSEVRAEVVQSVRQSLLFRLGQGSGASSDPPEEKDRSLLFWRDEVLRGTYAARGESSHLPQYRPDEAG